jgi:hypothetical protein
MPSSDHAYCQLKLLVNYADVSFYYYLSCLIMYYHIERKVIVFYCLFFYFFYLPRKLPWLGVHAPYDPVVEGGEGDGGGDGKEGEEQAQSCFNPHFKSTDSLSFCFSSVK